MDAKPTIVVYGNCAAQFLTGELRRFQVLTDQFDIHYVRNFYVPPGYKSDEPVDMSALPRCRFFLEQAGNFREDLQRKGAPMKEIPLPPGCRRIRFPPLFMNTLWPFVTRDPRSDVSIKPWCNEGPYPPDISNRLILEIMQEETDPDRIYDRFAAIKIKERVDLDRLHALTVAKIRTLDRESDLAMGPFIERSFSSKRLFRVQIHPAGPMLSHFCAEMFRCLELPDALTEERRSEIETGPGIGSRDGPIHPDIIDHFGLSWAHGLKYQHYSEGYFTYEEFIRQYIRFDWTMLFYLGVHLAQEDRHLLEAEALLNEASRRPNAPSRFFKELGKVRERLGWTDLARGAYIVAAQAPHSD
jgi:hypothetical protein